MLRDATGNIMKQYVCCQYDSTFFLGFASQKSINEFQKYHIKQKKTINKKNKQKRPILPKKKTLRTCQVLRFSASLPDPTPHARPGGSPKHLEATVCFSFFCFFVVFFCFVFLLFFFFVYKKRLEVSRVSRIFRKFLPSAFHKGLYIYFFKIKGLLKSS